MARKTAGTIHRKFIAAIAAAALIVTAFGASQAQAQNRDTERALAALLGLAVVGAIIAKSRDGDRKGQVVTRGKPHQEVFRDDRRRFDRDKRHHGVAPRPLPHRVQRNLLPGECLREVRTHRGGTTRVFGGRCLAQNYAFADRLPRQCAQDMSGRGHGRAAVWDARCLHRNGYRVSRR